MGQDIALTAKIAVDLMELGRRLAQQRKRTEATDIFSARVFRGHGEAMMQIRKLTP